MQAISLIINLCFPLYFVLFNGQNFGSDLLFFSKSIVFLKQKFLSYNQTGLCQTVYNPEIISL